MGALGRWPRLRRVEEWLDFPLLHTRGRQVLQRELEIRGAVGGREHAVLGGYDLLDAVFDGTQHQARQAVGTDGVVRVGPAAEQVLAFLQGGGRLEVQVSTQGASCSAAVTKAARFIGLSSAREGVFVHR